VGTVGQSLWRSWDGGESLKRASKSLFPESDIRAIAVDPVDRSILFAGSKTGVYRSKSGGASREKLSRELDEVRALAIA
jgi:photosystem II stability/assembly factor-like uncharacterized protein